MWFPAAFFSVATLNDDVIDQINHDEVPFEGSLTGKFYHCANKVNTR